jgi:hypothetical protein
MEQTNVLTGCKYGVPEGKDPVDPAAGKPMGVLDV